MPITRSVSRPLSPVATANVRQRGLSPILVTGLLTGMLAAAGCQGSAAQPDTEAAATANAAATADAAKGAKQKTASGDKQPAQESAADVLAKAQSHLERREWEPTGNALKSLEARADSLTADEKERLKNLQSRLETEQEAAEDAEREAELARAKRLVGEGDLDEAGRTLEKVLAAGPTPEQDDQAHELQDRIEELRTLRRKLRGAMELLASTERGRVRDAQNLLWDAPEVAFPLLLDAIKSENAVLVANALDMLRKLNQPERVLPAMVEIFKRPEQSASWPAVIRELRKIDQPGAGEPLLALALTLEAPPQRTAALAALAAVGDPPPRTIVALLPRIYADGPDLPAVLDAAHHSLVVNRQSDLATRRGLDLELTPEQGTQLDGLVARLEKIAATAPAGETNEAAWGARRLLAEMRQFELQPLPGVKVVRATAELPESPAAAVFDGVWNSVDVKTMWRHPPKVPTTIVLDLGAERTVAGIRIWNGNEQGASHRGWKDFEVYVSNSPSPVTPVSTGVVPPAPGLPATPDYGTTIPVPFARGRFVKLQFQSAWRPDGAAGLSEVQILGY